MRNEQRVIEAARAAFAERGPDASMEEIAARAGVGVGTIYRRFAGKDALLDAIAEQLSAELDAAADAALDDGDAERGLLTFLDYVGRFTSEKRLYSAALLDRLGERTDRPVTNAKVEQLTVNAVAAGVLSSDVTGADIKALLVALRGVMEALPEADDERWRRFVRVHIDGLRPSGGTPLAS
ncbi:TetR family transcriptional regulator [Frondihabitans australicus]|uniref:TetR family transcriptional regulator n=1 Tax=Frondihabitans australicus TaxID=386892 RepID=A0A495IC62_9MICO|nr:TetR family transcriptional regulator [Frondihabitans australicus]